MKNYDRPEAATRYTAPALEKGLDLLEALSEEPGGVSQKAMAARVGRTVAEIFRMLSVLERRGYVARDPLTGQYSLTPKLFELASRHPPTRRLQQAAIPVMQDLAERVGQTCHLVVPHREQILVVAEERSSLPMAFGVRLGAAFPFVSRYVSARVLAAFQPPARRAELARRMAAAEGLAAPDALLERLSGIAAAGHDIAPSEVHDGVIDISFPILDTHETAMAALTVPLLRQRGEAPDQAVVARELGMAARRISAAIGAPQPQAG